MADGKSEETKRCQEPKARAEGDQVACDKNKNIREWVTLAVNVVTLCVIFAYTCSAQEQAKSSASAAESGAAAAKAAAEASSAQSKSNLLHDRPWLVVSEMQHAPLELEPGKEYQVSWLVKNVGSLPALNVGFRADKVGVVDMAASNMHHDLPSVVITARPTAESRVVLGAGEGIEVIATFSTSDAEVVDVMNDKRDLLLSASATYGWPGEKTGGMLSFCYSYIVRMQRWIPCFKGNDVR
jgi:hypothetical protein